MGVSFFNPIGPYEEAVFLLKHMGPAGAVLNTTEMKKVDSHIEALHENLIQAVDKLQLLHSERNKLAEGFWWFLDADTQLKRHQATMAIHDQERVLVNIHEDLDLQCRRLKPMLGLRSRMFVADCIASCLSVSAAMLNFLVPVPLGWSMFGLLLLGPLGLALLGVIFLTGWVLLPLFTGVLSLFWAVRFPLVLIQYAPTKLEFGVVYTAWLLGLIALVFGVTWLTDVGVEEMATQAPLKWSWSGVKRRVRHIKID